LAGPEDVAGDPERRVPWARSIVGRRVARVDFYGFYSAKEAEELAHFLVSAI